MVQVTNSLNGRRLFTFKLKCLSSYKGQSDCQSERDRATGNQNATELLVT